MTHRERIRNTLAHQQPERVPLDCGSTLVTGIHVSCVEALRKHYGLEDRPVKVCDPFQMLGVVEPDLMDVLDVAVEPVFPARTIFGFPNTDWKPFRTWWGQDVRVPGGFNVTEDANGFYLHPEGDTSVPASGLMPRNGYFFDSVIRQDDIDEDHLVPEDNLEEFKPLPDEQVAVLKEAFARVRNSERAVIAHGPGTGLGDIALVPAPFLKHPKGVRDVATWYMLLASNRGFVKSIFERQTEIAIANLETLWNIAGERLDVLLVCGTDFGTQTSTFCSVETFDELWLPFYSRINAWIHEHTTWKTMKHSCGAVDTLIPSFIRAGFDILNPVQCSAAGMDPVHLKQAYGDDLVFWGGGVNTQQTLPFGSPETVREEVLGRCRAFAPGGGFVFNTIHNIQALTPVENMVALFDAVREFNATVE